MNGLRKCDIYTQWNFTQPQKKNEILSFASKWTERKNITLSEVSQAHCMFSSYVNAAILWDMGHTKEVVHRGTGQGKETKT
jgi:hypothetical protein